MHLTSFWHSTPVSIENPNYVKAKCQIMGQLLSCLTYAFHNHQADIILMI